VAQVLDELLLHTARPVFFDVVQDAAHRVFAQRLGAEEVADVIRHLHQMRGAHRGAYFSAM